MNKNVSGQKLTVFAFSATTNLPISGDGANITAYVSKDDGSVTALAGTSATETDATNAKGYYTFDLAQAETNAKKLSFSAKSSTANLVVLAVPPVVYTRPPNADILAIDGSGNVSTGGSGSGAYTVTITVDDGSTALQNAKVRLTEGVNTFIVSTNASGVATFSLDNATYGIAITKSGYTFTPSTQVVSGNTSATKSMTAIVIPSASAASLCVVFGTVINGSGEPVAGHTLKFDLMTPAGAAADGNFVLRQTMIAVSDEDGLIKNASGGTFELVKTNADDMPSGAFWRLTPGDDSNFAKKKIYLEAASYDLKEVVAL